MSFQVSNSNKRVVLAMSGGVDSSVACHLLLEQGYDVVGVFMRHGGEWEQSCSISSSPSAESGGLPSLPVVTPSHKQGCCSAEDAADARRVADELGIPFYALNLKEDFERIIDYFVQDYAQGRTPNPCVMCNNYLKFGRLFDYADSVGAHYVATGHYAQLVHHPGDEIAIHRGVDLDKDQSYVLFGVQQDLLRRMMLPIGGYKKNEIREFAAKFGLRVANKPDSQEICFVPPGQHPEFVAQRSGVNTAGEMVTTSGEVVANHPGIEHFTIGQRKGLGVAMGEPYYVVRIDAQTNQVIIGRRDDLARSALIAADVNWHTTPRQQPFSCLAQIRYNSAAQPATAHPLADGRLRVEFDSPRQGVAPGQAVVCYDDDRVLAGGWIHDTFE